jgi:arylsulfatase A-like enzyme
MRAGKKPNIILFLVDDMGWQDTSVPFHTEPTVWNSLYRTPSMERLASQGMRFTDAYSASPVCSPTRVSMMTGMNPGRTNVTDWVGHGRYENRFLQAPEWEVDGLQPGVERTLPEILRAGGYRTIHIGKGHFGGDGTPGADPTQLGFDVSIGGSRPGSPDGSYFLPWDSIRYPGLEAYPPGTYINDALTKEANQQIDRAVAEGMPFFMNMAHYAVHTPIIGQGDPDYLDGYADRPDPEDDYAALLESMDASLGAILDNLERHGIAEETLIVFFSDNGGLTNHTRNADATYSMPDGTSVVFERDRHNSPLKGGKGSAYEGGVRVPMIVSWAGRRSGEGASAGLRVPIEPGSVCASPVISDDLLPTLLSVAGLANGEPDDAAELSPGIDGMDLSPLLRGDEGGHADRILFFHYPHQWYRDVGVGQGIQPFTAMRKGSWKLIYFYGDGYKDGQGSDPWFELYDLSLDIGETEDLAEARPEVVRSMAQEMHDWMVEVSAQTPVSKETNEPVPLPRPEVEPDSTA